MWLDAQAAAIAEPESHVTAELLGQIRTSRAKADSLRKVTTMSGARVVYHTQLLVIDSTSPASGVSVLPDDTTRMDWVSRKTDATRYPVPTFFVRAYTETRQAYVDERAIRVYQDNYTIPLAQQLADSLAADRRDALEVAAQWKKKANPRCGTKCKLLLGAGTEEALRALARHWLHG
jgi:hypothetical protein